MNEAGAKNIIGQLRSKQYIVSIAVGIAFLALLIGIAAKVMTAANDPMAGRVQRSVDGTDWAYKVDPVLETQYKIAVTKPRLGNAVLVINGVGCNKKVWTVWEVNDGSRIIGDRSYDLEATSSTKMSCAYPDEENPDVKLETEVEKIFQSLE